MTEHETNGSEEDLLDSVLGAMEREHEALSGENTRLQRELTASRSEIEALRAQLHVAKQEGKLRAYLESRAEKEEAHLSELKKLQRELLDGNQRLLDEQTERQEELSAWETEQRALRTAQQGASSKVIEAMHRTERTMQGWHIRWTRATWSAIALISLNTSLALGVAYLLVRDQPHRVMSQEAARRWSKTQDDAGLWRGLHKSVHGKLSESERAIWYGLGKKALGEKRDKNERDLLRRLPRNKRSTKSKR